MKKSDLNNTSKSILFKNEQYVLELFLQKEGIRKQVSTKYCLIFNGKYKSYKTFTGFIKEACRLIFKYDLKKYQDPTTYCTCSENNNYHNCPYEFEINGVKSSCNCCIYCTTECEQNI